MAFISATCAIAAGPSLPRVLFGALTSRTALRGTPLTRLRPNENYARKSGEKQTTQAMIINPAVLKMTQRLVARAIPGRLILAAARRTGLRIVGPLAVVGLVAYSLLATWWAAQQAKKAKRAEEALQTTMSTMLSLQSVDEFAYAAPSPSATTSVADVESCPTCGGKGTLTWEGLKVHEGAPCPRCLGTGVNKRKAVGLSSWPWS